MQRVGRRDTPAELALRSALHGLGLRFRVDVPPLPGVRCRADLLFGRARVAVFVDGCFWHGCREHASWPKAHATWWRFKIRRNRERDRETDRRLAKAGWRVVRVWSHESPTRAAQRVLTALSPPAALREARVTRR